MSFLRQRNVKNVSSPDEALAFNGNSLTSSEMSNSYQAAAHSLTT